ncbi:MAG: hypothetical protein COA44_10045 [Arcobacter sp.]|nr:MAG: hypothetical protein COA44_10045 [Arcobacter sp.]
MLFDSLNDLLEHIKQVEKDTITISREAQMKLSSFIERNNIEIDDEAAEAMQYQDIVSQQLSATIEAIELVQKNLQMFSHTFKQDELIADDSVVKLRKKMNIVLQQAKAKKAAFSGHIKGISDEHEIEFF